VPSAPYTSHFAPWRPADSILRNRLILRSLGGPLLQTFWWRSGDEARATDVVRRIQIFTLLNARSSEKVVAVDQALGDLTALNRQGCLMHRA
jgi:hypothetical protein